jgi:hypothetical protein
MKAPEKNEILNDILGGDELNALRDATIGLGLDALRRRARRRQQIQVVAVVAPLLVLAFHLHYRPAVPTASESAPTPPPLAETGKVKYITEKELFALFPNRPIALIGKPGHQQFLLLDELGPKREQ